MTHTRFECSRHEAEEDSTSNPELTCEPVGSGPIATSGVKKNAAFWRTCVRGSWVMRWIDHGYELQWTNGSPVPKEARNSPSALAHAEIVTSALSEMLAAGAISKLPTRHKMAVVSPLGVVPKGKSGKLRLIINMRYVNDHLIYPQKKV